MQNLDEINPDFKENQNEKTSENFKVNICSSHTYKPEESTEIEINDQVNSLNEKYMELNLDENDQKPKEEYKEFEEEEENVDGSTNLNLQQDRLNKKFHKNDKSLAEENQKANTKKDIKQKDEIKKVSIKEFISKINEKKVVEMDGMLKEFSNKIKERVDNFKKSIMNLEGAEGFFNFSKGFTNLGFNIKENGISFKEYAPGAKALSIVCF